MLFLIFRITEMLKQLFWSQNTNEEHNAKYPDRGRRGRESVESDPSSPTTLMNSSEPRNPLHLHQPDALKESTLSFSLFPG